MPIAESLTGDVLFACAPALTVAFLAIGAVVGLPAAPVTAGASDPRDAALAAILALAALSCGWAVWWARRTAERLATPLVQLAQTNAELPPHRPTGLTEVDELAEATVALRSHLVAQTATMRDADVQLLRARHAVERANRVRATFLSNMSHELRTPLAAMIGTADAVDGHPLDPTAVHTGLQTIRESGSTMLALLQSILEYSRLESGQLTMEPSLTPLRALLEEVVAEARPRALARGLSLEADLTVPYDLQVVVDPDRLRLALRPLLDNAVKFTPRGSVRLRERSELSDGMLKLEIAVVDTGVGIAPEHHAAIFEPFDQIDNSASRLFGGMGLGLALAHRIAVLLGGALMVESRPGAGSCFTLAVNLPLAPHRDRLLRERVGLDGFPPERMRELTEFLGRLGYAAGPPSPADDILLVAWQAGARAKVEAARARLPGTMICVVDVPADAETDAEACGAYRTLAGSAGFSELAVLMRSRRELLASGAPSRA